MLSKILDFMKKHPGKSVILFFFILLIIIVLIDVFVSKKKKTTPKTTPKTEKEIILYKLKNVVNLFNLSTTETFGENVVFNNGNNIINNLKLYFDYAFPGLDYDEVNKKLKEYNVNLTAFEIFEKHKNVNIDNNNIEKYLLIGSPLLFTLYHIPRLNFSDMEDVMNKLKLSYIISKITTKIFIKEAFNIKFIINKDYLINDTINIYYRTNKNESINIKDAVNNSNSLSCLDENKLCKSSENIKEFAMKIKSLIKEEEKSIHTKFFYVLITIYLMELENISTDKIREDNMELYNIIFPSESPSLTTSLLTSTSAINTLSSSLGSLLTA